MANPANEHQPITPEAQPAPIDTRSSARNSRRLPIILIGSTLVLLLGAVVAIVAVRSATSSPERAVTAFFRAIADRDADAALRAHMPLEDHGVDPDMFKVIIVERSDIYTPPTNMSILDTVIADRAATVKVSYTLGSKSSTAELTVQREDSTVGRWKLVDGVGMLDFSAATEVVQVGPRIAFIDAYDANGPLTLPALPGDYTMGAFDLMLAWDATTTVTVVPGATTEVRLPTQVNPSVSSEVQTIVGRMIASGCAEAGVIPIPGCPLAELGNGIDSDWLVTDYPPLSHEVEIDEKGQVLIHASGIGGRATDMSVYPPKSYSFRVTGTARQENGSMVFEFDR
jgi:hypothetical protein